MSLAISTPTHLEASLTMPPVEWLPVLAVSIVSDENTLAFTFFLLPATEGPKWYPLSEIQAARPIMEVEMPREEATP
ncbi:hypothetical protein LCGC14_0394490 [marine sediment metagenome]|uniref:Uncharacterized protein n=1 Tax=marine sediment metagenome TaxID=412755 RepID=A0A0F9T4M0_9ZZZZ